jgi:hypothetical protein
MSTSFAASTCRTTLTPFRQFISDSSALRCDMPHRVFENCGRSRIRNYENPFACKQSLQRAWRMLGIA